MKNIYVKWLDNSQLLFAEDTAVAVKYAWSEG